MTFRNPVVGGSTLVRTAIRSPNYVVNTSGWSINRDGSAEFTNVTIRGSGTQDTLIVGPSNGAQVIVGSTSTLGFIEFPTHSAVEDDIATIVAGQFNAGAANETLSLQVQSATTTGGGGGVELQMNSEANDSSIEATWAFTNETGATTHIAGTATIVNVNTRLSVLPTAASVNSLIFGNAVVGHTGNLLRLQLNAADQLVVNADGEITTYGANAFDTYTPTVTNGGTATFTTQTGFYQKIGKMVFVRIYLQLNAAGSGASNITIALPSTPFRSGARQCINGGARDGGVVAGPVAGLVFAGGAGAVIDRVVDSTGADVTGAMLTAGSIWTIEGWYREA